MKILMKFLLAFCVLFCSCAKIEEDTTPKEPTDNEVLEEPVDLPTLTTTSTWLGTLPTSLVEAVITLQAIYNEDDDIYYVETASQLAAVNYVVTYDNDNYGAINVSLKANIDLNNKAWTPIGISETLSYRGTFMGNGATISNLTINSSDTYVGFFGYVSGGSVKYINISAPDIQGGQYVGALAGYINSSSSVSYCNVSGGSILSDNSAVKVYIGGLVGYAKDSDYIYNCSSSMGISVYLGQENVMVGGIVGLSTGTTIQDCSNSGSLLASSEEGAYVGGVAAYIYSDVISCSNSGTVTAGGDYIITCGGVVGAAMTSSLSITSCYNTGAVKLNSYYVDDEAPTTVSAGGIIGRAFSSSPVLACYNTAAVSAVASTPAFVNMYVGGISGATASSLSSCYNIGEVSSTNTTYLGGVNGYSASNNVTGCYYLSTVGNETSFGSSKTLSEMTASSFVSTLNSDAGANYWQADSESTNNGCPVLK